MLNVKAFFHPSTYTLTYLAWQGQDAVLIDPVMDFFPAAGRIGHESCAGPLGFINQHSLKLHFILETHVHADHLSGAQFFKQHFPSAQLGISSRITEVQDTFNSYFNTSEPCDGSQFDLLLEPNATLDCGEFNLQVIPTPGHTPACTSFLVNQHLFVGDCLFMPDFGVGRCDFPGGDAGALYDSITQNIYSLPPETVILVGHDYQPGQRELRYETTVAQQRQSNIHLDQSVSKDSFVSMRTNRDKSLSPPQLLIPSLQINIRGGRLPSPDSNGTSYLRWPVRF